MTNPRVVIVGAGFGGLSAAKAPAGKPFDVTVIDQHNYHLFQPLLYQVATAGLSPADIASPIRGILAPAQNVNVMLGNRHGRFPATKNFTVGTGPDAVELADLNGDGKVDLIVSNYDSSNVSVLLGNGDGTFQSAKNYTTGNSPSGVTVAGRF